MPLSTIFHVLTVSWTIRSKDADQDALFGSAPV